MRSEHNGHVGRIAKMTVTTIHETAIVDRLAELDNDVAVGPYSVIGPNVKIGAGSVIGSGVNLNWTTLGKGCQVGSNSVIGGDPQIYGWKQVESWVRIADDVIVREITVIHRSRYEGGATIIGPECYVMTQVHIGHDCKIEQGVTVSSLSAFGGHVDVGRFAVIGGSAGIHQFVRIGQMAMVGGMTRIVQDVAPYFLVSGIPAKANGLNVHALKKHKISADDKANLKKAYKHLVRSRLTKNEALEQIENDLPATKVLGSLVAFVKESTRGLTL